MKNMPDVNALTAQEYAEGFRRMMRMGYSIDDLNAANHFGLRMKLISFDKFNLAARVLADEILKR